MKAPADLVAEISTRWHAETGEPVAVIATRITRVWDWMEKQADDLLAGKTPVSSMDFTDEGEKIPTPAEMTAMLKELVGAEIEALVPDASKMVRR